MSLHRPPSPRKYGLLLALFIFLFFNILSSNNSTTFNSDYDLARWLNVPSYVNSTLSPSLHPRDHTSDYQAALPISPHSILAIYDRLPFACYRRPYLPRLRKALQTYATYSQPASHIRQQALVSSPDILVVHFASAHIASNDTSLSNIFVQQLIVRARYFKTILLIPTPCTPHHRDCTEHRDSVTADIRFLKNKLAHIPIKVIAYRPSGTDHALYLMHKASNLLVHRGPFSALAALSTTGTVYYTPELADYINHNQFRWLIKTARPAVDPPLTNAYLAKLNTMGAVQPSCCDFHEFGVGDGAKVVCTNTKRFLNKPCWVLSVGCNGKWSFERSVFQQTSCYVHTFDCTGTWDVPPEIADRVTLHKLCLGVDSDKREDYKTWKEIISIGSSQSHMPQVVVPALVKMDIEGAEFPVLDSLLKESGDSMLPEQLAVEVHVHSAWSEGPPYNLFNRLKQRGYVLVHRADNPYCIKCSEITLVRESGLPSSK